jgi:nucleoid-associated protein YgaU
VRSVLWIVILLTLCASLWAWNVRITSRARAEREELRHGRASATELPEGWGRAVVGEASGAPLVDPPPAPVDPRKSPGPAPAPKGPEPSANARTEHVVAAGESLSKICQAHYGTAHPDVVGAVARANKIEKVDQLRVGGVVVLPPLAELKKDKR